MALTAADLQQQKQQAEELLFSGKETLCFAKGLFFGHFGAPLVFPYPQLKAEEQPIVEAAVREVRKYCAEAIDAAAIDNHADIPRENILGLAHLGVLGMTAPKEVGGRGFSQLGNCKIMEVIGGHCASTAVFVNAHHSIGIRALPVDRLPVVGHALEGLYVVATHSGITLAPALGELVAAELVDDQQSDALERFRPARFEMIAPEGGHLVERALVHGVGVNPACPSFATALSKSGPCFLALRFQMSRLSQRSNI